MRDGLFEDAGDTSAGDIDLVDTGAGDSGLDTGAGDLDLVDFG